LEAQGGEERG